MLAAGGAAFAQRVAVTNTKPVVDGVIKPGEYSFSKDFKQLTLYVTRTADALYVGVVGETTGWVAFGLGSLRMDGATIFMGFVGTDGKVQFKPQAGRGHTHHDTTKEVSDSVIAYAMKETGSTTTLEVELKPDMYIKSGQGFLDVIYAEGTDKSFVPYHMFRGAIELTLAK